MEGRDILILLICATAILISFPPTGHIKFTPTWQIKVDTSNYRNGNSPLDHEKLYKQTQISSNYSFFQFKLT